MKTVTIYRLLLTVKDVSSNEFLYHNISYTCDLNQIPQYLNAKICLNLSARPGGGLLEIDNPEIKPPFKGVFPAKLKTLNHERKRRVRQEMYDKILNILAEYDARLQCVAHERAGDYSLFDRLAFNHNVRFLDAQDIDIEIEYSILSAEIEEKKWT